MRKLSTLSATLISFSFIVGCADDAVPTSHGPTASTSETNGAPLPSPTNGSGSHADDGNAPPSDGTTDPPASGPPASDPPASDPPASDPPTTDPPVTQPDPGPKPTEQCSVQKDKDGFFTRTSSKSDYVAYVPASYSPDKPMRVVVGLHGCGDNAMNFATWGVAPYDSRAKQDWIGISVGGETGSNKCWAKGNDDDKVLAAVDDVAKCFWVDRNKVVIAGFSSGGELAYRVGMMKAEKFAGILIESSSLSAGASGTTPAKLLASASWKLPIAHRAHTSDTVFPINDVKADWDLTKKAGFPLTTSEVAGGHDGTSTDWATWLIPQSASWALPTK